MALEPRKRQRLMERGIGFVAASQEKKGEAEELIAKYMHCSVSTVRRLCTTSRTSHRSNQIAPTVLSDFAGACLYYAPEIPIEWVEKVFSANGMVPAYMSDTLKQVVESRRQKDSNAYKPTDKEHSASSRRPRLADQRHLLRAVDGLVGRDEELDQVKEWLTTLERRQQPVVGIVVIGGMPGVGKTALAQAVGQEPAMEQHFQDGVLWAELGPKPDVERWLREWAVLLGMPRDSLQGPSLWLRQYLTSEERRVLIILDDVWPETPFEQLMIGGMQCQVLIASQVATVADLYEKVRKLRLEVLEQERALRLALRLFERKPTKEELEGLEKMVKHVGGLPVAIQVAVAAMKSDGVACVVEQLQLHHDGEELQSAETERLRRLTVPGSEPRQASVPAAFQVGYDLLEKADQRRFRALGNLVKLPSFGVEILAALWEDETREAREAARRLVERSLLEQVGENRYRIHSLLHDFSAKMLEASGEQDADGMWADRFQGRVLENWRWWWPSIPRPPDMTRLFSRGWLTWGLREHGRVAIRYYLDLARKHWKGEGVPAEVWVVGLWLYRRMYQHLFRGFSIVGGFAFVAWVLLAAFFVLKQGSGEREALGLVLYGWLYYSARTVLVVFMMCSLLTLWIIGVDLINFHRFYHLPMDRYETVLERRQE
jgi:hypothetical protein